MTARDGIRKVICNEDVWYFRLGARLGVYRKDLTHSTIKGRVMAVPRAEVDYWRRRVADLQADRLPDGPDRALLLHESVHCRQMAGRLFWLWGLRYVVSKRFRRRIEEEAYTEHLTYLAGQGVPLYAAYWIEHFRKLYAGAFAGDEAERAWDRILTAIRRHVPGAPVEPGYPDPATGRALHPWLAHARHVQRTADDRH